MKADQYRDEQVKDRVDTTGLVWMGLTIGCAKCHSHKYDPIEQVEYYQLYAFFNDTADNNSVAPTIRRAGPKAARQIAEYESQIAELRDKIKAIEASSTEPTDQKSVDAPAGESDDDRGRWNQQLAALETESQTFAEQFPVAMILKKASERRKTHLQTRGDFLQPAELVKANVPNVLPAIEGSAERRLNRLDFAQWLVRSDHPLTARVRVNRIWLRLFGRGLVETDNDFGVQGVIPSHPALLDWLAAEFQRDWSTKRILRLIVTSATYRQTSKQGAPDTDPQNRLLSRQARIRVDGEIVRDLALSASGLLTETLGGPSVYPPQPDGVYAFTQHQRDWPTSQDDDRYRRGMYTFFFRSAPHPMLSTFDTPKFNETCTRRNRSNTPLQSLTVANDEAMFEAAQALASRVILQTSDDDVRRRVTLLFRTCVSRSPSEPELDRLEEYIATEQARQNSSVAGEHAVWTSVARVVMNLDEFIVRE